MTDKVNRGKLASGEREELGEILSGAFGKDGVGQHISDITQRVVALFEEKKEEFEQARRQMVRSLKEFLAQNPNFEVNSGTIQEILKLQRRAFATRINIIEHQDDVDLGAGEMKLDDYAIKIFSTFFRDDILRTLFEKFFEQFPDISSKEKKVEIPENTQKIIYDILRDSPLTMFLIMLKERGLIDMSDNIINKYEIEEEVKLINIDKKKIIKKLKEKGAKLVFSGEVEDTYFDYPDGQRKLQESGGMKSTFRIRKRTHDDERVEHFYTIKRKLSPEEEAALIESGQLEPQEIKTRRCHEKELIIKDFEKFKKKIKALGLVEVRKKIKKRESYIFPDKDGIKFDFDSYEGYNDILELEGNSNSIIKEVIEDKDLELAGYERLVGGSTKFFEDPRTKAKKNK